MLWCDFFAGWAGGCLGILVGQPLDTLKVRQQAFHRSGLLQLAKDCFKNEGAKGFFKGMSFPLATTGVINSLFFGVYGAALKQLSSGRSSQEATSGQIFVSGCAGGAAQLVLACPTDLVKIKMQVQTGPIDAHYSGPMSAVKSIWAEHGLRGLYKGLPTMALRDIPSFGLYIMLYESLVMHFSERLGGVPPSPEKVVLIGGATGVLSWAAILPLDVIKSRLQADDVDKPRYKGLWDCARQCYSEGGARVFTRGFLAVTLRAFPVNGATFLGYEYCLQACRKLHLEPEQENSVV